MTDLDKSEFLSVLAKQIEVILGSFEELPHSNTVVEVSEELSLLQVKQKRWINRN